MLKSRYKNLNLPKVGMRTIKTAIAVFVCLVLYEGMSHCVRHIPEGSTGIAGLLRLYLANSNILYALFASVVGMQNTMENSVRFGKNRILGTAVGGAVGILTVALLSVIPWDSLDVIIIPLGVIALIYACNLLSLQDSVQIATIVYFIITISIRKTADPVLYAFNRWLDTVIGTLIALGVNSLVRIPKKSDSDKRRDKNLE